MSRTATEGQKGFLRSLVRDIAEYAPEHDVVTKTEAWLEAGAERDAVSATIDAAKSILSHLKRTATPVATTEVPEGVHLLDGQYVKVQRAVHGSGKLYAKVHQNGDWVYAGRGPLADLSEDTVLTAEQAAEFGHLYGQCVFCSRPLTDERSIAVGYGSTCAENHGLPWG